MKTNTMVAATTLALGILLAAPQASAQKYYVGAGVGSTDADAGNVNPGLITAGSFDGKDSGTKLFGGYQLFPNFAVELAYVDLGKILYNGTFSGSPVTGGTVKTSGLNVSAIGILPLNASFSLFAKGGVYSWDAKARDTTGGAPFFGKEDGADLSYGFGASYHVNRNFSLRAEWEQFDTLDHV
jgi:OOP family OmpA-OmpF porin